MDLAHGHGAPLLASDQESNSRRRRILSDPGRRWKYHRWPGYGPLDHEVSEYPSLVLVAPKDSSKLTEESRYRRYKIHCILAALHSIVCFTSLIINWRGNTNVLQSLLIFSGGFGTGQAHSAVFVALANGVAEEDMAIASSGFYLSSNIGGVLGVSVGSTVHQVMLRRGLMKVLKGRSDWKEVSLRASIFIQTRSKLTRW